MLQLHISFFHHLMLGRSMNTIIVELEWKEEKKLKSETV